MSAVLLQPAPTVAADDLNIQHLFAGRATTVRAELVYLALPALLFFGAYLSPSFGLPLASALMVGLLSVFLTRGEVQSAWSTAGVATVFGAIAIMLAGFPSGPYVWDWVKHWAIANELARNSWPVSIDLNGVESSLRFYLGAYLVPAGLVKLLPGVGIHAALGAWFFLGYVLVFRGVAQLAGSRWKAVAACLIVLVMGGADAYAEHAVRALQKLSSAPWFGLHYDAWATHAFGLPIEFSSMLTALVWVPHQSIATFIVSMLLLFNRQANGYSAAVLAYGLLALWSPYGMIGLLPLMVLVTVDNRSELLRLRTALCVVVGVAIALAVAAYLSTELPAGGACFTCIGGRLDQTPRVLVFLLIELCAFGLILRRRLLQDITCVVSLGPLIVLPFLYGNTPDLVMRASMGPLFVLTLRSIQTLFEGGATTTQRSLQILAFVLCVPAAISEAVYVQQGASAHQQYSEKDPLGAKWIKSVAARTDFDAKSFFDYCGWEFKPQYFAKSPPRLTGGRAP